MQQIYRKTPSQKCDFNKYYVHTKVNLFGFITEYNKILIFIRIAFTQSLKIYSDRGQILMKPIKFDSTANLNKSFADSFQYAITLFVFHVCTVSDAF